MRFEQEYITKKIYTVFNNLYFRFDGGRTLLCEIRSLKDRDFAVLKIETGVDVENNMDIVAKALCKDFHSDEKTFAFVISDGEFVNIIVYQEDLLIELKEEIFYIISTIEESFGFLNDGKTEEYDIYLLRLIVKDVSDFATHMGYVQNKSFQSDISSNDFPNYWKVAQNRYCIVVHALYQLQRQAKKYAFDVDVCPVPRNFKTLFSF